MIKIDATDFKKQMDEWFKPLVSVSRISRGYLKSKRFMRIYSNIQRERWQSQGGSEGQTWKPLNQKYSERKRQVYKSYPGSGTKILIATGRLLSGILPEGERGMLSESYKDDFKSILHPSKPELTISTGAPYAKYVDETRPFMTLSDGSKEYIKDDFNQYLSEGLKKGATE